MNTRPMAFLVTSLLLSCSGGGSKSAPVGPAGGTLRQHGVTLVIPPGALELPVEIRVVPTADAGPAEMGAVTPLFRFEPDGLAFAKPVEVTLPLPSGVSAASIYWSRDGGGFEPLRTFAVAGGVTAFTTHFSTAFLGTPVGGFTVKDATGAVVGKLLGSALAWGLVYQGVLVNTTGGGTASVTSNPQVFPSGQLYTVVDAQGIVWNVGGMGTPVQPEPPTYHATADCTDGGFVYWGASFAAFRHDGAFKRIAGTPVTAAAAAAVAVRTPRSASCLQGGAIPAGDFYYPVAQLETLPPPSIVPPLTIE